MVRMVGFEPTVSCFQGKRISKLSHTLLSPATCPLVHQTPRGPDGIRTRISEVCCAFALVELQGIEPWFESCHDPALPLSYSPKPRRCVGAACPPLPPSPAVNLWNSHEPHVSALARGFSNRGPGGSRTLISCLQGNRPSVERQAQRW